MSQSAELIREPPAAASTKNAGLYMGTLLNVDPADDGGAASLLRSHFREPATPCGHGSLPSPRPVSKEACFHMQRGGLGHGQDCIPASGLGWTQPAEGEFPRAAPLLASNRRQVVGRAGDGFCQVRIAAKHCHALRA